LLKIAKKGKKSTRICYFQRVLVYLRPFLGKASTCKNKF